ncbi:MAG: ribonuclease H-like domain-containing protein [Candidatus Omnitrophota bacterium]
MARIVFDIETVGTNFDDFDPISQESLLKYSQTPEEEQAVKDELSLSPITGEIVAIGMLDCESDWGAIFFQSKDKNLKSTKEKNIDYVVCSEKEILENFWSVMNKYNQFVTYNGRGFDCPYILIRSGVHKIKPTQDLMPYRYETKFHVDLYDQLTFYGAIRRGFSLHMVTQAFGIKSPKQNNIDGAAVHDLFMQENSMDIARYCMRDVQATKELYWHWVKYVKAPAARNKF